MTLSYDERMKADLCEQYPDWEIWYVPGAMGLPSTWCARLASSVRDGFGLDGLINVGSPGELERAIQAAERASKPLDPESDAPVRVRGS